jgi:hypothetical protein
VRATCVDESTALSTVRPPSCGKVPLCISERTVAAALLGIDTARTTLPACTVRPMDDSGTPDACARLDFTAASTAGVKSLTLPAMVRVNVVGCKPGMCVHACEREQRLRVCAGVGFRTPGCMQPHGEANRGRTRMQTRPHTGAADRTAMVGAFVSSFERHFREGGIKEPLFAQE